MEVLIYIFLGIAIGGVVGWLLAQIKHGKTIATERAQAQSSLGAINIELSTHKATSALQTQSANEILAEKQLEIVSLKEGLEAKQFELAEISNELSTVKANLQAAYQTVSEKKLEIDSIKEELKATKTELSEYVQLLAKAKAKNDVMEEKFESQKKEIEDLGKKFNTEFENIANKILDTKTEKFTESNRVNLSNILEPFGKNILDFRNKVEEVYDKESKERFSLGEKVKELASLNQKISEEARNLTNALKGESKTQGRWGEMILESVLEKSGLVKGREYFMEHELLDKDGNHLRSDSEGKKMRPDVVIKYPDNRSVIIDSKVSLNAFTRLLASSDSEEQKIELAAHVGAIKNHILALSAKGYDDYDKALDFVMMFVPSEPAYIAALQGDADLWNFAYEKRILLLSPTNLITSLKLIVDLWKREYQNRNALDIAERGAKLYDKFVGFVNNLTDVGKSIEKAQEKYDEAYKQLSTGNDNLVSQATKLKDLGVKNKKDLPKEIVNASNENILSEENEST